MKNFKVWLALSVVAMSCWACGMSEGQTANLYVSQMIIYERRVEADAYDIGKLTSKIGAEPSVEQCQELMSLLQGQAKRLQETLDFMDKANCPQSCKNMSLHYKGALTNRLEHCQALIGFLKGYHPGQPVDMAAWSELQKTSRELSQKAAEYENKIHEDKAELANMYPEVQLPEVAKK
ncbi:MAG: hypothetical protein ACI38Q_04640 [Candidatus Bruticola sp.]